MGDGVAGRQLHVAQAPGGIVAIAHRERDAADRLALAGDAAVRVVGEGERVVGVARAREPAVLARVDLLRILYSEESSLCACESDGL
jgi:hypothetical protein